MTEKRFLRIGEVVNRTGLSERMIRHYERLGLIRPDCSTSGQRLFDAAALADLAKVQILKQAGFKLNDIGQLLSNTVDACTLVSAQLDLLRRELDRLNASVRLLEIVEFIKAAKAATNT